MGATSYFDTTYVYTNAEEAFRNLQRIIGAEDGSGIYAGNISIVPGFSIARRTPMTEWEASEYAQTRYDNMDKWGPGEAVALLPKDLPSKTRTMRVNLTAEHNAALDAGKTWFNANAAAAKVAKAKLRDGERIVSVRVTEGDPVWKPVVTRSTGKATRSFVISGQGTRDTRYNTLAEAVEASKAYVARQTHKVALTISEEVVRDNEPRATVEVALAKHMVTVEVAVVKPTTKQTTTIGGWVFYGMAPC